MAAATPLDAPVVAPATEAATRMVAAAGADGAPGAAGGTPPTLTSGLAPTQAPVIRGSAASIAPADTAAPADGAYPGPNNTYIYSPKYRKYPVSTVGKLFFTEPGSGDYVCTATATYATGGNLNTIWTAGHCVAGGGTGSFYNSFYFCPSYDSSQGGTNPAVGCWSGTTAGTTTAWLNYGSWTRDMAYITLATTGTVISSPIVTAVGGLGLAWNQARDEHWFHFGYPSASPYTGGKLIVTATEHRYDDSDSDSYGPATNAWGSAQTPGSSGSAVLTSFNYTSGIYINSNVSFYYTSPTNEYGIMLHGPYYDTTACNFWKGATGWTGSC
jgi:V8-like Glu-specific endopeptidase